MCDLHASLGVHFLNVATKNHVATSPKGSMKGESPGELGPDGKPMRKRRRSSVSAAKGVKPKKELPVITPGAKYVLYGFRVVW
jgi:hypothetical protein